MKGVEYMDKTIIVRLLEENGKDYIRFFLEDEKYKDIDLNSNDQSSLRDLYKDLINMSFKHSLNLKLEFEVEYDKILFKEIATEFINDLKGELDKIRVDDNFKELIKESVHKNEE